MSIVHFITHPDVVIVAAVAPGEGAWWQQAKAAS